MNDSKPGRKTSPGFADPLAPIRVGETPATMAVGGAPLPPPAVHKPQASLPPSLSNRPRTARPKPLVEVEVIRERSRIPRPEPFLGCYEIWTQNNVYAIDARMRCIAVRELSSGEAKTEHPFVGARLVGGQAQEDAMEMSYPLPRTGAYAVFEMRKGNRRHFTRTSAVERVVLRLRIVTIADGAEVPSWEDLIEEGE